MAYQSIHFPTEIGETPETLHIFMQYKRLELPTLIENHKALNEMFNMIIDIVKPVKFDNISYVELIPTIELDHIETGHSISFSLIDGWKPTLSTVNDDIKISLPKTLGTVGIMFYLIIQAASQLLDIEAKMLENEKTKLEIEKIKIENQESIKSIEKKAQEYIIGILKNKDIESFEVNGVQIKKSEIPLLKITSEEPL